MLAVYVRKMSKGSTAFAFQFPLKAVQIYPYVLNKYIRISCYWSLNTYYIHMVKLKIKC